MYALNLNEDRRILSVTYPQYAPESAELVETLPEGNVYHYLYIDGQYVYDPLPIQEKPVEEPAFDEVLNVLLGLSEV